jgi:broad specificity phosphatase PhoE
MACALIATLLPAFLFPAFFLHAHASTTQVTWEDLKQGGYVLLLRHAATVPGTGDPPGYNLRDCRTQRNLSDAGREQAKRWGEKINEHQIPISGVFTSQWCRTKDTATLAFGRASEWPPLNSFFDQPQNEARQTTAVKRRIGSMMQSGKNVVLVTHGVNILALTALAPQAGEAVIAKVDGNGGLTVAGRLLVE